MHVCLSCLQPIKIKLRQNQVESAIMCQIKTEHNVGLVRLEAMHKRTPVFTFMFGKDGNLLNANAAAMTKFGVKSVGERFHMCNVINCKSAVSSALTCMSG